MRKILLTLAAVSVLAGAGAQQRFEVKLYPRGVEESNGLSGPEKDDGWGHISNISEPKLRIYLPEKSKATGQIILVCPGGGYRIVSSVNEGVNVAEWLMERGIATAELWYRLPNGHHGIPIKDAQTAMELIRKNAAEWGIDPDKAGVMGFSAGGHLASTVATHFTKPENRPDYAVLVYPVITMDERYTHRGSREALIGKGYNAELVRKYSNELQVTPETPPTFLVFATDDKTVPVKNGLLFYEALVENKVPAEFHIYPLGGHGWGFTIHDNHNFEKYRPEFYNSLDRWLKEQDGK